MADVAGLAIGVVALVSLFNTCVDCFELIDAGNKYSHDVEILLIKLDVEKTRLLIWGESVGLLDLSGCNPFQEVHRRGIAARILNCILMLFQDSEKVRSRYGLQPTKESSGPAHAVISLFGTLNFRESYTQFQARIKATQKDVGLMRKCQWAIHDRTKFANLIIDVRELIDGLNNITPELQHRRSGLMHNEVSRISNTNSLRLIEEACADDYRDLSDTASVCLEASSISTNGRKNTSDWLDEATVESDWQQQEHFYATKLFEKSPVSTKAVNQNQPSDLARRERAVEAGIKLNEKSTPHDTSDEPETTTLELRKQLKAKGFKLAWRPGDKHRALKWAAENGNNPMLIFLLKKGASMAVGNNPVDSETALHLAARQNHQQSVQILLQRGANIDAAPNPKRRTALHTAVRHNCRAAAKALIESGANLELKDSVGQTALANSVSCSVVDTEMTELLLAHGASTESRDVKGKTPIFYTLMAKCPEAVNLFRLLVAQGANILEKDADGDTVLHISIRKEEHVMMRLILNTGSAVHVRDSSGRTPLHIATSIGDIKAVTALLDSGADVNTKAPRSETPLHLAANSGSVEVVRHLLKRGACIDARNSQGATPLTLAAEHDHADVARYLIINGAEVNTRDDRGGTPLYFAACNGHVEMLRLLTWSGANVGAESWYRPDSNPDNPSPGRTLSKTQLDSALEAARTWRLHTQRVAGLVPIS